MLTVFVGSAMGLDLGVWTGRSFTVARTYTQGVVAAGSNLYGQLSVDTEDASVSAFMPVVLPISDEIVDIAAGKHHTLFLLSGGSVYAAGRNHHGQLGDGTRKNPGAPVKVNITGNVIAVAAGGAHSLFLMEDGTVQACGLNSYGQLGLSGLEFATNPVPVINKTKVAKIAAGIDFSYFLTTGSSRVMAAGNNLAGQLGDGTFTSSGLLHGGLGTPGFVKSMSSVKSIAAGESHGLFLTEAGELWATGANFDGQLGVDDASNKNLPIKVADLVQSAFAGGDSSCYLKDSKLYGMGSNRMGQLGLGMNVSVTRTPTEIQVQGALLAAPASFHSIIMTDDALFGLGSNQQGELGLAVPGPVYSPGKASLNYKTTPAPTPPPPPTPAPPAVPTPAPTTEAPATEAPATEAPATEAPTDAPGTTEGPPRGGFNNPFDDPIIMVAAGGGAAVVLLLLCCCFLSGGRPEAADSSADPQEASDDVEMLRAEMSS